MKSGRINFDVSESVPEGLMDAVVGPKAQSEAVLFEVGFNGLQGDVSERAFVGLRVVGVCERHESSLQSELHDFLVAEFRVAEQQARDDCLGLKNGAVVDETEGVEFKSEAAGASEFHELS